MDDQVWLMPWITIPDLIVIAAVFVLLVPWRSDRRAGLAAVLLCTPVALVVIGVLFLLGGAVIVFSHPDPSWASVDWHYDAGAWQWALLYALYAAAGLLVALSNRLLLTRGIAWWWRLGAIGGAALCTYAGFALSA